MGLTATPKDDIDKNTYEVFELANGEPTFGYELAQAVADGVLVDFMSVETRLKFLEEGIAYDELSAEDRENSGDFRSGVPRSARLCHGHRQLYDLCPERH